MLYVICFRFYVICFRFYVLYVEKKPTNKNTKQFFGNEKSPSSVMLVQNNYKRETQKNNFSNKQCTN